MYMLSKRFKMQTYQTIQVYMNILFTKVSLLANRILYKLELFDMSTFKIA